MGLWSTGVTLVRGSVVYKCRIGPRVCGVQVLDWSTGLWSTSVGLVLGLVYRCYISPWVCGLQV